MRGKAGLFFGTAQTTAGLTVPDGWDGNGSFRIPIARTGDFDTAVLEATRTGTFKYRYSYVAKAGEAGLWVGFYVTKNEQSAFSNLAIIQRTGFLTTYAATYQFSVIAGDELEIVKASGFTFDSPSPITGSNVVEFNSFSMWIE